MVLRRDALQATLEFTKVQLGEVRNFVHKQADIGEKMTAMLERMEGDLNADMSDEAAFEGEEEGGEDGVSGK